MDSFFLLSSYSEPEWKASFFFLLPKIPSRLGISSERDRPHADMASLMYLFGIPNFLSICSAQWPTTKAMWEEAWWKILETKRGDIFFKWITRIVLREIPAESGSPNTTTATDHSRARARGREITCCLVVGEYHLLPSLRETIAVKKKEKKN